jgi:hypothetical protein
LKLNDSIGIYHHMEVASPEARHAQLVAEMEQLSLYRRKKITRYQAWSRRDPESEDVKASIEAQQNYPGIVYSKELIDKTYREMAIDMHFLKGRKSNFSLTPIPTKYKFSWYQRFLRWIIATCSKRLIGAR